MQQKILDVTKVVERGNGLTRAAEARPSHDVDDDVRRKWGKSCTQKQNILTTDWRVY
jgi:hypothetical protein